EVVSFRRARADADFRGREAVELRDERLRGVPLRRVLLAAVHAELLVLEVLLERLAHGERRDALRGRVEVRFTFERREVALACFRGQHRLGLMGMRLLYHFARAVTVGVLSHEV